ncbi:hypothetical protein A0J61_08836 [Choanephora cucurbitarum]|uniref:Uncharacterized protein n=1 Tax=Choanephora cucurbitarum TaxID=101091 RepID=A0A1C7N1X7_9FUNG|nr:hypothetical protein A0J61_08836 [Choanephora cucurbitarum]
MRNRVCIDVVTTRRRNVDEQSQIVSRSVVYFVFEKDEMLHQRIVSSFAFAVRLCEVEEDMETDKYALSL